MVSSASPDKDGNARAIVLLGAGGHARVALDVCRAAKLTVAGFIDSQVRGAIEGLPVLGGDALLSDKDFIAAHRFLPAIGGQKVRRRLAQAVLAVGGRLATVAHPAAVISLTAQVGDGTLVVAGAVINTGARIGRFCIINTHASIDHDCVLEDGAQIGPGATLCGGVQCGSDAMIGAGAVLLPGRRIGAQALVGAGAVVTRDVTEGVSVTGNPARVC